MLHDGHRFSAQCYLMCTRLTLYYSRLNPPGECLFPPGACAGGSRVPGLLRSQVACTNNSNRTLSITCNVAIQTDFDIRLNYTKTGIYLPLDISFSSIRRENIEVRIDEDLIRSGYADWILHVLNDEALSAWYYNCDSADECVLQ